ncbi:hypothetical protein DXG03_002819 [Asterophora parasitica]|uniref:Uncharacterized protein n=1 Tax=Asterophora parasitica TaxID=117018 RepID=A0A9P7G8F8_9AGAR|nr:hypothetical protein DXG03_002819 [Asterophora parasitica]
MLDAHASSIACFTTPRPLVRIRLKVDDNGGRERERTAVQSLAIFGSTLSTLIIEHSSIANQLVPAEVFGLLAEATPNLKILVYTKILALGNDPLANWECSAYLAKFPKLGVLALHAWGQNALLCETTLDVYTQGARI